MSSIGDTHHHPMPRRNIFMFRQFFLAVRCLSRFDRKIRFANEAARCSAIAQLVEQATVNRPVVGSSPTRGASPPIRLFLIKCGLDAPPARSQQSNFSAKFGMAPTRGSRFSLATIQMGTVQRQQATPTRPFGLYRQLRIECLDLLNCAA